jgi:hypothetical protein
MKAFLFALFLFLTIIARAEGGAVVLDGRLHHLRSGTQREWDDFPKLAEGPNLVVSFKAERNATEYALRWRQQDVRQTWRLLVNGKELTRLPPDENDMVVYVGMPAGRLRQGENTLTLEPASGPTDDIRFGEIMLDNRPPRQALGEAEVEIAVDEMLPSGKSVPTPCRITILNAGGSLMSVGAASNEHMAVRPGVIYSGTGRARFGLPAGEYTIHAGRGPEYGLDTCKIKVHPGHVARKTLAIRREVSTPGYASCDTHIHTLTYSGHGDARVEEQVLALAGEAVELAIATEHNRQMDYHAVAVRQGVRKYFTPVVGNEVTTAVGHFNVFPVSPNGPAPDHTKKNWPALFDEIALAGARFIVLNHPRDIHLGFRPFGLEHHLSLTGDNLDGWKLRANAMEVINSGAQQSDMMAPFRDWFGMLNRGINFTPIGASDSHDVARYFVGQARTYIRCRDDDPGNIDIREAVENLQQGRVMVSCGLLAEITIDGKYGPGDLVPGAGQTKVDVRVLGPSWVRADRVELYANGKKIRDARITCQGRAGIQWAGSWILPRFHHDVHLVAIASGPGVRRLYWPMARPYQNVSTRFEPRIMGATGAVWIDADGDGKKSCARDYAQRLLQSNKRRIPDLIMRLKDFDEAVAVQAANLLRARGISLRNPGIRQVAREAGPGVERAFEAYFEAWRASALARRQQ